MALRKINATAAIKHYESVFPAWSAARDALGKARQAEAVDEQTKEEAFDELAKRYPALKGGN